MIKGISFLVQSGVLQSSYTFIGISFFRLGKFSYMILLSMFTVSLSWTSSYSIPIILGFRLFMVSQISSMFYVRSLLDLMFSLTDECNSSMVSSIREILSSISYNLLFCLHVYFLFIHPDFPFQNFLQLVFFFLPLFQFFKS